MAYAVQANLETRYGSVELAQLSDRVNGSVIDVTVVARALADADAEIDAWLGGRYALPLASVPAVLERVACDIARYRLYDDRATEQVRQRYEDAIRDLKAIAAGTLALDGVTPPAPADGGNHVNYRSPERVFNADALSGY